MPLEAFAVTAWQAKFPWGAARASRLEVSSIALWRVWNLNQHAVETLTLDAYSDSNARQRSSDCQADDTVAAQAHYATSAELGLPRFMATQIMNFARKANDADSSGGVFPWPFPSPTGPGAAKNGTGG